MTAPPPPPLVRLAGIGLRSGRPASVALHALPGPFALLVDGVASPRSSLCPTSADRATVVRAGGTDVATVEHLFAACAAFGLHEGLTVEVEGGEVPLLDGAAGQFSRALSELDLPRGEPPLRVVRDATLTHGESRYTFGRARGADLGARVEVTVDFADARISPGASWDGSREDFVARIANARTFALAHEVPSLAARGQASHVDPASVIVLTPDEVLVSGAPYRPDEPARHKLLDLLGDLFLYGGPPRGLVHAFRPGHAATHAILARAIADGVVA